MGAAALPHNSIPIVGTPAYISGCCCARLQLHAEVGRSIFLALYPRVAQPATVPCLGFNSRLGY